MSVDVSQPKQKADTPRSKSLAFVNYIISRCQADNGLRAALKRADNPATEYQSWEVLAGFQVNLEYDNQRLPYATIAAAIVSIDCAACATKTAVIEEHACCISST